MIPLQASTCLLGHLAFADLERRCRAAWGAGFSLRRFHAWALAWPPIPPARMDPGLSPAAPCG